LTGIKYLHQAQVAGLHATFAGAHDYSGLV
jgi:hypothetical protein